MRGTRKVFRSFVLKTTDQTFASSVAKTVCHNSDTMCQFYIFFGYFQKERGNLAGPVCSSVGVVKHNLSFLHHVQLSFCIYVMSILSNVDFIKST